MRIISADAEAVLQIGKQGENASTQIDFGAFAAACLADYGAGTLTLVHQRKTDEGPYAIALSNNVWTVTSADVAVPGTGLAELTYTVGSVVRKSLKWKTCTLGALGETVTPPAAWQGYVDQVTAQVAHVTGMTVSAETAAGTTPTVTKGVDAQGNVHLTFGLVKGDKGDPGSDVSVTAENIAAALAYTPADNADVTRLKAVEKTVTPETARTGYSVRSDGAASIRSASAITVFVPVSEGDAVYVSGAKISVNDWCYLYSEDNQSSATVPVGESSTGGAFSFFVPEGSHYFRGTVAYDPDTETAGTMTIKCIKPYDKIAEKADLAGKQDVISDLDSIRAKANSAVQTETDPTVPSWAKAVNKPTYQANEIAMGDTTVGAALSEIEEAVNTHNEDIAELQTGKQDTLTAGDNITIVDNVISASGGGASGFRQINQFTVTEEQSSEKILTYNMSESAIDEIIILIEHSGSAGTNNYIKWYADSAQVAGGCYYDAGTAISSCRLTGLGKTFMAYQSLSTSNGYSVSIKANAVAGDISAINRFSVTANGSSGKHGAGTVITVFVK